MHRGRVFLFLAFILILILVGVLVVWQSGLLGGGGDGVEPTPTPEPKRVVFIAAPLVKGDTVKDESIEARDWPEDDILDEMSEAAREGGGVENDTFWRIPDRREAIRFGTQIAQKGDTVISCGKGHEQSMCFGEIEYPWDDRTAVRAAICERLEKAGPKMPNLPDLRNMK